MTSFEVIFENGMIFLRRRDWEGVGRPEYERHELRPNEAQRLIEELSNAKLLKADYDAARDEKRLKDMIQERDRLNEEIERQTKQEQGQ